MSSRLLERINIVPAGIPADINGAGITGDYISLKNYDRVLCCVIAGDGTAGQDIPVSLYQATAVAGTGAKVLNALETGRIFTKEHASAFTGITGWTKETQATADEQWAPGDSGEQVLVWGLEIKASDLDVDNGFDCIRMDVADPSAAKVVCAFYILGDCRYPAAPELMPDPLVD